MRVTYDVNAKTSIQYKLVSPTSDKLNIRYRVWLELSNKCHTDSRSFNESNDIWFYDETALDNMIDCLLSLKDALNRERNAVENHIDAIESIAKVC